MDEDKICLVCCEEAPPDESHRPHYGGICCFSCRAFFRRSNQGTKKVYQCKAAGKCVILPKTKHICKKCRYDKCLEIGMDPSLVLTDEEKRIRFKHFFKKKDELASLGPGTVARTPARERKSRTHPYDKPANRNEKPRTILPRPPILLGSTPAPGQQVDSNNKDLSDSTNFNSINNSINNNNNSSQTITLSIQQLQQILGLHGQNMGISVIQPGQINISPNQQSIQQSQLFTSLQNPLMANLQMNGLNHVPSIPGINHTSPAIQTSALSNTLGIPASAPNFVLQNCMSNNSSSSTDISQGPDGVLTYKGVNYIRQDQAPAIQPIIIVMGGSPPPSLTVVPAVSQIQPVQENSKPDNPADEQVDDQRSVDDEPEDNAEHVEDRSEDSSPDSEETSGSFVSVGEEKATSETDSGNDYLSLKTQVSCIIDAFTLSCGKLSLNSESSQDLILNHQRLKPMEKTTLISQLSMIATMLTSFAYTQSLFLSLTREDQGTLLKNNIPIYLQYILARYFSAETGLEQVNWILEGQITIDSIEELTSLNHINLMEYNNSVNFFPTSEIAELYYHFSENIGIFYPFPQHCNGLVANMLLYHTDENIQQQLQEGKRISCIFDAAADLVKMGHRFLDRSLSVNAKDTIGPLIHTLTRMLQIFGTCKVTENNRSIYGLRIPKLIPINFTHAEERWIGLQFHQFQEQFRSVIPTQDYFNDAIRLLVNEIPVSDKYMPNWLAMTAERARRVLKIHPEFEAMPDRCQEALWAKNKRLAVTLAGVRINLLRTGRCQFKDIFGIVDSKNTDWERQFDQVYDLNDMKSHYLNDDVLTRGKLDDFSSQRFFQSMRDLSEVCFNDQTYQLITFLTLLDTDGLTYSPHLEGIMKVRQIYLKFYQRKLKAVGCTVLDYSTFKDTLKKVKLLTDFMDILFN